MASLGNNYGSATQLGDWKTLYKMAKCVNDTEKMNKIIASIQRSKYADSTKQKTIKDLLRRKD